MVSKFSIYTVHLKCFDSIRYNLNQNKTLTKNFNQTRTYIHTYIHTYGHSKSNMPPWGLSSPGAYKIHVGPLHKIQGYQGHQNVRKRRPHHSGDICTTRGNNLKTIFSFMGQNVKKKIFWGYFGGPEGVFNDQTKPILLSSYPLTHIYVYVK